MKIGVSTACFYPMHTEDALKMVVQNEIDCTELFFNSFSELTPRFVKSLCDILATGKTAVTSIHPFTSGMEPMLFFGDYDRRINDGLEMYKLYCEAAVRLGAKYIVLHGAYVHQKITSEQYVEDFYRLHTLAKSYGVAIAQENVGRCKSGNPELLRLLRREIPDIAFVLDLKQVHRCEGTIDEFLEAMGSNIVHLHLSDANDAGDCLPIGAGNFDFSGFFERMAKLGYTGDGVLELYRHNYTQESELWDSARKLYKSFIY